MKHTEHTLQTAVAVYLAQAMPLDSWWTSVDAGQGRMGLIAAGRRKARGVKAGVPDVLVLWSGRFRSIELKVGAGRPSEAQRNMGADIVQAGGGWLCANSIAEVEAALIGWGIPLRPVSMLPSERDARVLARLTAEPKKRTAKPRAEPPTKQALARVSALRGRVMF
jgi:hypothetical protein